MVVILSEGESISRPAVYAEVSWRTEGPAEFAVDVDVRAISGQVLPDGILRRGPNQIIVTRLPEPLAVTVRIAGSQTFPPGATVGTSVTLYAQTGDDEQIVLDLVDVSGATLQELFRLEPGDHGQWLVRASAGVEDGLARLAFYSARRSRPDIAPGSVGGAVPTVAVDLSASMRPLIAGGQVAVALEILVGLNAWAHGLEAKAQGWAFGTEPEQLQPMLSAATHEEFVRTALQGRIPESGASHRALIEQLSAHHSERLTILCDGVPGDVHALPDALAATPRPMACTYLVFAHSAFDTDELERPQPVGEELSGLFPLVEGRAMSVVAVAPERVADLATDQRRLDLLVGVLVERMLA